jgi:hypothetical protein
MHAHWVFKCQVWATVEARKRASGEHSSFVAAPTSLPSGPAGAHKTLVLLGDLWLELLIVLAAQVGGLGGAGCSGEPQA